MRPTRGSSGRLQELFEWLGLDVDENQLATFIERHTFNQLPDADRGPNKFFRSANPGLWRENLTGDEQTAVNDIIGAKLREVGYES